MAESEDFLKHTIFFKKRSKCSNVQGSHIRRGSGGHMEPTSGQSPRARWFHNSILQISLVYHQKGFLKNGEECFQKKKIEDNTKSSYLALIPKEANPSTFNRFRLISFCNSSYKIIKKIIANRIKEVLPIIISGNQGGFVPNRKIIDNVIIVQEAVHSSFLRQEKCLIIKLDMANAFNRVSHPYLMAVFQKLGFSREIVEVI